MVTSEGTENSLFSILVFSISAESGPSKIEQLRTKLSGSIALVEKLEFKS